MIPILYEKTEMQFTSNGLGRLADCSRCIVTEERNGIYECEFDYPITGPKYSEIEEGRIIAVTHDDNQDIQPFDIYHRTAPINGIVTFYARHISYRQIGITVKPFTASGIANAIAGLKTNSIGKNDFSYWTNKETEGTYTVTVPSSLRSLLGGEQNSLLDVFGTGEYEFDKFTVKLWTRRGEDTPVEIRYGKNLTDLEHDIDFSESYNGIVPYWFGTIINASDEEEDVLVTLPEWAIYADGTTYNGKDTVLPLDLSGDFDEPPTVEELRTLATSRLHDANTLTAIENIRISFVQLWQTEEYKDIAPLQKVNLCDTVSVIFPELGLNKIKVKVIRTVYNVLMDRYDEMEVGDSLASYASIITANNTSKIVSLEDGLLMVSSAANSALKEAETAHMAAISAQTSAGDALSAAQAAQRSADSAGASALDAMRSAEAAARSAEGAQEEAEYASASAERANKSANAALNQLSIVEDVVGTLSWISEHGTYALSQDTEVVPGKYYFTKAGDSYNIVATPSGNPASQGYYELSSIDEAVSNYVASHLALTSQGLWVTKDNEAYKILLANDGMKIYDDEGNLVASFGESISFSSDRPQYIGGEDAYIVFDHYTGTLNIGGTGVVFGGKSLSEVMEDIEEGALPNLRIDSSRGTVFKNTEVSTVLSVVIYYKTHRIDNLQDLRSAYNSSAYLQWQYQGYDEITWHTLPSSDSRLSNDGFSLTLSPADVNTKIVFRCELLTV